MEEHNQPNNEEQANANKTLPENVLRKTRTEQKWFVYCNINVSFIFIRRIFIYTHKNCFSFTCFFFNNYFLLSAKKQKS